MDIMTDGPTLVLTGDFDVRTTGAVRTAIYDHLVNHCGDITIDVSGLDSIDLTALRVVAAASRRALRDGQHIVLRGACPAMMRMLHLTHLIRFVELERDREAV